jgi:predicted phage terminase large subunit-like protein
MHKKISKELQQRWQDRIAWIQSASFEAHENEAVKGARISRARKDYSFFVKHYFTHLATKDTAKFQKETAEVIKRSKNIKALLEWARGHAKSSHVSLLIPLWLMFQEAPELRFMVLVSKSQDAAIRLLSDLQAELQYNEKLTADFGKQVLDGHWADGEFITTGGTMFIALGRGQSPRGLKNRGKRPDYIVIDDIDDDELVRNPKRVGEVLEWILTALFGAMEGGRGRFIMVGNRIGKDSVLSRFAALQGIYHTVVNMLDKKGNISWPENYTMPEVESIKELIGERRFQKEYMNNPINEGTVFLQKQIHFGKILDLKFYRSLVCYTDPSFKDSSSADYKATMLVGKTKEGAFHVIKAYADQGTVAQMVRWHYEIDRYIDGRVPVLYFMESNFLQDLLLDEFKKTGTLLGHHIPVRGDSRKKPDKFARIEAMQPLFERGLVLFNEKEKGSPGMRTLEEQLLMFERGTRSHDDAPDALEGAIFLLNQRTRTATASYAFGSRVSHRF